MLAKLLKKIRKPFGMHSIRTLAFTEDDVVRLANWRYADPYSAYNIDSDDREILEFLNGEYFAAYRGQRELIGFYCIGGSAQLPEACALSVYNGDALDFGLGLRPDLVGFGLGEDFVNAGIDFLASTFRPDAIRLTVAAFNVRAIKVYERTGFVISHRFEIGNFEFYLMIRKMNCAKTHG